MSDQCHHCPFLNRADARCAAYFSLDRLEHAFEYCFDRYHQCPVYPDLVAERGKRRIGCSADDDGQITQLSFSNRHAPQAA